MIEAVGLTKKYGSVVAVDHVDLHVDQAGVVGFLGPNGAGKTTTMRMLTGYLPMTDGTARVAGFDVFDEPQQVKARVGYLPETPPLYPELTVGEYLRFVAEMRGLARGQRLSRVGQVMEQVGLRGWEGRLTGSLSKGYRQRVGLAQALLHNPPVLILDEPTSGLDPAQLVGIRKLVKELAEERVVVLSTHILHEVEILCERVVMIHKGRIVGDGAVDAIAAQVGAGPWLELVVTGAGDDATARLAELSAITAVEALSPDGELKRFRLEGGGDMGPQVAELCTRSGWALRALAPHRASLEEVFLTLVGAER